MRKYPQACFDFVLFTQKTLLKSKFYIFKKKQAQEDKKCIFLGKVLLYLENRDYIVDSGKVEPVRGVVQIPSLTQTLQGR